MSRYDPDDLDPAAREASRRLCERLRAAMNESGGAMPFEAFMDRALYEPGLGYYRGGAARFGAGGDFATAPELSALFSRTLARQAAEILDHLGGGDVIELGPGTGRLAADALAELEQLDRLPRRWRMLEVSAALRQEQEQALACRVPHLLGRVEWLERLPADPQPAVWIANEVLDALPVRRFVKRGDGVRELGVRPTGDGFTWTELPADDGLQQAVAGIEARLDAPLPEGYVSEVCTRLTPFLRGLADALPQGVMLWLDYGYPRREYYLSERHRGTLLCHFRHRAHDDPFFLPGLQDITAFVDFTAVADAALAGGLEVLGYTPQGPFLMAAGLDQLAETELAGADAAGQLAISNQVQRLTHPGDMGERFKVLALGRGYQGPLSGFTLADRRGTL
ncbi:MULTISPECIES: class I SAM-dependent methyltransferase [unclassified Halorhodospira]|uniref:class I SAM-dependent methyltransferase n=1 Tax=unclassified Halorhodospira TaxID=2626748 RepID=UPI001EE90090|nr:MULTISPECIES: SAM-dependent methyltransferase [unclassified Halorhodospira]MCG5540639.1 SAM-dependent methyltransferase [Halorhodospira sp. M39old]MCG5546760.1 SAM-dependent methyltransferase [Halorhodospira sp. M38]